VQQLADVMELGIVFNLLLVNPQEAAVLRKLNGGPIGTGLSDWGIDEVYASNRVPPAPPTSPSATASARCASSSRSPRRRGVRRRRSAPG
jgi:hypothetical protein